MRKYQHIPWREIKEDRVKVNNSKFYYTDDQPL